MAIENYTKICNLCFTNKSIDNFGKAKTGKYGVRAQCKDCRKVHIKKLAEKRTYSIPDKLSCTKCNVEYDCNITNFKKSIGGKYHLTSECRKCLSIRNCNLSKLPKYKEMKTNWNLRNIDKKRAYARKSAVINKERISKYQKLWKFKNIDRLSENGRRYYLSNKDRLLPIRKSWQLNNLDKLRIYAHNYRAKKLSAGSHSCEDITSLLIKQKYKCIVCKCYLAKYEVDHIHPISKGGSNEAHNLQILCPRCNKEKSAKDPIKFMQQKGYLL